MSSKRTLVLLGIALVAALALAAQLCSTRLRERATASVSTSRASDPGESPTPQLRRTGPSSSSNESDSHAKSDDRENARHLARPALAFDSASPHGALVGRVVDSRSRRGVAGAELSFMHEGVSHTITTASDGSYRFEAPIAGTFVLATLTA